MSSTKKLVINQKVGTCLLSKIDWSFNYTKHIPHIIWTLAILINLKGVVFQFKISPLIIWR
ncbi:hypothetical protein BFP75_09920 [Maribacter sp. 4G9]|nr:hypothetical protein BFP75_09920 [Maribacter sp. 4G9]